MKPYRQLHNGGHLRISYVDRREFVRDNPVRPKASLLIRYKNYEDSLSS